MIDSTWAIATGLLATLGPALIPETGSWGSVLLIVGFAVLVLGLAVVTYLLYRRTQDDSIALRLLFGIVTAATVESTRFLAKVRLFVIVNRLPLEAILQCCPQNL